MSQVKADLIPQYQRDIIDAIEDARLTGKTIQISNPRQAGMTTVQRFLSARPVGPVTIHKDRCVGPTRIELADGDYAAIEARVLAHAAFQVEIVLKARQKSDGEARLEDIMLHRLQLKS